MGSWVAVPSPDEDAGGCLGDPEGLRQRDHVATRARTERPCALVHRASTVVAPGRHPSAAPDYPGIKPWPRRTTTPATSSSWNSWVTGFSFNALDFEQRVNAAAVKLGVVEPAGSSTPDETADLVESTAQAVISSMRSELGEYIVRHRERIALVRDESLVYWLRKLIFRGAWLDQRVKENLLEVSTRRAPSSATATHAATTPCSNSRPRLPGTSCSTGGRALGLRRPWSYSEKLEAHGGGSSR